MATAQRARGPLVHLGVLDPMVDLASPGQALSDGVTWHAALTLAVFAQQIMYQHWLVHLDLIITVVFRQPMIRARLLPLSLNIPIGSSSPTSSVAASPGLGLINTARRGAAARLDRISHVNPASN